MVRTDFPSGYQIQNVHGKNRLLQIQTPEGNINFSYLCGTWVGSVTKGAEYLVYTYDGKLRTSETLVEICPGSYRITKDGIIQPTQKGTRLISGF